jgi:hypothetical protein
MSGLESDKQSKSQQRFKARSVENANAELEGLLGQSYLPPPKPGENTGSAPASGAAVAGRVGPPSIETAFSVAPSHNLQQISQASAPGAITSSKSDAATSLQPTENLLQGRSDSNASVDANQGPPPSQGINTDARNALISKTGREFGPDIALKVGPKIVVDKENVGKIKDIINSNSSITEVLNILAFLLNNDDERKRSVITDFSYGEEDKFKAVYASFTEKVPPLFDIETLTLTRSAAGVEGAPSIPPVSITIPGTILKRDERYGLKNDIILNSDQIQPLITACILQMVNILENTRQVFGGWAKLFKGMQGGSNSKSKTKTRRNNRRRH